MLTRRFLEALRDELLVDASCWHSTCARNADAFPLTEFGLVDPTGPTSGPTWQVPVAWNLTCAIRFLSDRWYHLGAWPDYPRDAVRTRIDTHWRLAIAAGVRDLDQVRTYAHARQALDAALLSLGAVAEIRA